MGGRKATGLRSKDSRAAEGIMNGMPGFIIGHEGGKMKYVSICNAKKKIPKKAKAEDVSEWVKVSRDALLHKKCKMIRCYETLAGTPQKLIIMMETDEPDALKLLCHDFGSDWNIETYPLHEMYEVLEQDHSIVAG